MSGNLKMLFLDKSKSKSVHISPIYAENNPMGSVKKVKEIYKEQLVLRFFNYNGAILKLKQSDNYIF